MQHNIVKSIKETQMAAITAEALETKINATLADVLFVKATDVSDGCGSKFELEVVCTAFIGKPLIAQHRLVNKAIEEERKYIHAITIKTRSTL